MVPQRAHDPIMTQLKTTSGPLLEVRDLRVRFCAEKKETEAVAGISFALDAGKILALVGESGSGKSVSALALARLLPPPPACLIEGEIRYAGRELLTMPARALQDLRGKEIAYVFQEPVAALNPAYTIGFQIAETVRRHFPRARDIRTRVVQALEAVGIRDATARHDAFPHELSGGMAQRAMIAMALACRPRLLVADEPTTALDATIQKQIMQLLADLRDRHALAILLITHNFGIVANFADEVAVMRHGRIIEHGATATVLTTPRHPYTQTLINSVPRLQHRPVPDASTDRC
jgi:ABC-type dipeptide/oligopeptide/nickel transport system ATPase component